MITTLVTSHSARDVQVLVVSYLNCELFLVTDDQYHVSGIILVSFSPCRWCLWCSCWVILSTGLWKVSRCSWRKSGSPLATNSANGATWIPTARAAASHPFSCSSWTVCTRWVSLPSTVLSTFEELCLCYVTPLCFPSDTLTSFMTSSWAHDIPQRRTGEWVTKARNSAVINYTLVLLSSSQRWICNLNSIWHRGVFGEAAAQMVHEPSDQRRAVCARMFQHLFAFACGKLQFLGEFRVSRKAWVCFRGGGGQVKNEAHTAEGQRTVSALKS